MYFVSDFCLLYLMCSQQLAGSTSVNSKQRIVTLPVVGRDDKKPLQQHVHLYVSPNCLGHERIKQGFHVASRDIVVSTSPTDAAAAVAFILYLAKGSLDEQKYQAEIAAMIQDGLNRTLFLKPLRLLSQLQSRWLSSGLVSGVACCCARPILRCIRFMASMTSG